MITPAPSAPEPTTILRSVAGVPVPLQRVSAHGHLTGLVFELSVEQHYTNTSSKPLEAVFTFPLPSRAVLLGFDLEIGERKLAARAVAKAEASADYERAIDSGDTAALIEHDGDGLYTVSLGNLRAGDTAVVRYRYAELLDAHDGYVRAAVPTAVAPRYGDPADAKLTGPAVPGVALLAEYPFDVRIELAGLGDAAGVRSPSHSITTAKAGDGVAVTLARRGFLDRDFVLELAAAVLPQQALVARGSDGYVALASVALPPDHAEQRPLALKILLDCSGSMQGSSIAAAKRALLAILARLGPRDRVSLTRFGSRFQHVTEGLEPADPHTLPPLTAVVRTMGADLGGTELQAALEAVLEIPTPSDYSGDVVLITDGEIYSVQNVVARAARSGQRLFAIAIGVAPNEPLARSLAAETAGACEFVNANDDAEAAILRTFKRLRAAPRVLANVDWPARPLWTAPLPSAVFPGDTLHVLAGFAAAPAGRVTLTVRDAHGVDTRLQQSLAVSLATSDVVPRLAAARRLSQLPEDEACALAVQHQLASLHTSFVVVAEHAAGDKAIGLPATVAVPHMLAAGWAGSAKVADGGEFFDLAAPMESVSSKRRSSMPALPSLKAAMYDSVDSLLSLTPRASIAAVDRAKLLASLAQRFARDRSLPATAQELVTRHGLDPAVSAEILDSANSGLGHTEEDIVRVLLALLADESAAQSMDSTFLSALRGTVAGDRNYRSLRARVRRRWLA